MPRTAANHSYPFTEGYCVAPSSLSKCQSMERRTSATHLPVAGECHHLQDTYIEATDQGPLFTDERARTISPPLTAGPEVAPASPIMAPPCSGELRSPRPSSDVVMRRQARQACYEFSHGNEDLEIMFELNSDMGITLRQPESAGRRWRKRGAEEAPEGELGDLVTSVPSGSDDWAATGLDMGQAPMFWGDGSYSDVSGGEAVQTLELLGDRLHRDAQRQLELTDESCVWFGPDSAV
ncbi:unnamed protein product [Clonostachys byssicola]|uniref:Uncharacterized protein n=1 Tax=Clonostachys byssicola TaxID=160290 RepID=A0A9N9U102_9HYPO|nr:unnamed protein product [Clonostachys byssicola]